MNQNKQQVKLDPAVKQEAVHDFTEHHGLELADLQRYLTDIVNREGLTNLVPHSLSVFIVPQLHYPVHCNVFTIYFSDLSMPRVTINFGRPLTEQYTCSIFKGDQNPCDREYFIDFGAQRLTREFVAHIGDCIISNILIADSISRAAPERGSIFSTEAKDKVYVRNYDIDNDEIVTVFRDNVSTRFTVKTVGNKIVLMVKSVHDFYFVESLNAVINYVKDNFDTMPILSYNSETLPNLSRLTGIKLKLGKQELEVNREGTLFTFSAKVK